MKVTYSLRGAAEVLKRLQQYRASIPQALAAGVYQEALAIDALSNAPGMCPVDTGRLRASHYVAPPEESDRRITAEVGYGVDYAAPVHERTWVNFRNGRAKWLEQSLNARAGGIASRLASRTLRNAELGIGVDAIPATAPRSPQE